MNIFILDYDPRKSIQYHMDAHVRKMAIEYVQILSTALRTGLPDSPDLENLYKSTHIHHPCVKWATESWANWRWLVIYAGLLHDEYFFRFGKQHASRKVLNWCYCIYANTMEGWGDDATKFPQAMPNQYKTKSTVAAYRAYYIGEKQHLAKWTGRPIPEWFEVVE